ncbi:alpha/beta hydrolase [Chryseolinea soli]|uniref:Alpha/beta hydrolase n=1 Tax=Chryseolinea soli TaxID=2321403 RepID=A0A385SXT5_9BACT|nr:alpha/beta hydrolase [Chryseolinea soli]AYB34865.1 alpha/beta hydrolase [Chryseolinea soli]
MDIKIKETRSGFDKLGGRYGAADNVWMGKQKIKGTPCHWFFKEGAKSDVSVMIYLHGGCYAVGSIKSHQALVSHLSAQLDATILFVDYSLAPEHPFPTAVNEVLNVYNYLVDELRIQNISFVGDSAGGGLTASVVSILNREKRTRNLRDIVMISPWIDLRNNGDSIEGNRSIDPVLTKESLDYFTSLYVGNKNLAEVNPMETLYGTFPPTLIMVGSNEILLDDSKTIFSRIVASQPLAKLKIYQGQTHVWLMDNIQSESAVRAINDIRSFLT